MRQLSLTRAHTMCTYYVSTMFTVAIYMAKCKQHETFERKEEYEKSEIK